MEDQYCRLCMAEQNLRCTNTGIRTCIKTEYSIEITDNDDLSKVICQECEEFISDIIEFRGKADAFGEKITKTQKFLLKVLKKGTRADSDANKITAEDVPITENPCTDTTSRESDELTAIENSTDTNVLPKNPCVNATLRNPDEPIAKQGLKDTNASSSNNVMLNIIRSINPDQIERSAQEINYCTVCKIKAADAAKFQRHLGSSTHICKARIIEQYSDPDILSKYGLGYKCPCCPVVLTSKAAIATHAKTEHNMILNKNNLEPDTLIPKNIKNNEENSVEKNDEVLPEFNVKDEPDSSVPEFEVKVEPDSEMSGNPISQLKFHPCIKCEKSFGFAESLQRHQRKHHKGIFFCMHMHCNFSTISRRTFLQHLRKQHYNLNGMQKICSTCFKVCESHSDLRSHRKEFHTATIHVCLLCNEKFQTSTLLKKHKRDRCTALKSKMRTYPKNQLVKYPCSKKCGERFENYGKMERHATKCNSERTIYSCKQCHKSLKGLESLKMHLTKCSSRMSSPNAESAVKIQKTSGNQASCSSLIQPSLTETNDEKDLKPPIPENGDERIQASCSSLIQPPPADTNDKENVNPSIPSTSLDNFKTQEPTVACQTCGLLFKDLEFLAKHNSSVHASAISESSEQITEEVIIKVENEDNQQSQPEELPTQDPMNASRSMALQSGYNQMINVMSQQELLQTSTQTQPWLHNRVIVIPESKFEQLFNTYSDSDTDSYPYGTQFQSDIMSQMGPMDPWQQGQIPDGPIPNQGEGIPNQLGYVINGPVPEQMGNATNSPMSQQVPSSMPNDLPPKEMNVPGQMNHPGPSQMVPDKMIMPGQGGVPNVDIQSSCPVSNQFIRQNTPPPQPSSSKLLESSPNTVKIPNTTDTLGTIIRQSGPTTAPSPNNKTLLNTPGNQPQPSARPCTEDEQEYRDKIKKLSGYIGPLERLISCLKNFDNKIRDKIETYLKILSSPSQRIATMETLMECEDFLEKFESVATAGLGKNPRRATSFVRVSEGSES